MSNYDVFTYHNGKLILDDYHPMGDSIRDYLYDKDFTFSDIALYTLKEQYDKILLNRNTPGVFNVPTTIQLSMVIEEIERYNWFSIGSGSTDAIRAVYNEYTERMRELASHIIDMIEVKK